MTEQVLYHPNLICSPGTRVVILKDVLGSTGRILHPRGAVGVIVRSPENNEGGYRIRFPDGVEATLAHREIMSLAKFKEGEIGDAEVAAKQCNLYDRVALHKDFEKAFEETTLPERPDYERANQFLIKARRSAVGEGSDGTF